MKIILLITSLLLCSIPSFSQKDSAFIFTYGGKKNDVCNQVKSTYDKGYILTGTTNSFGFGHTCIYAVKTDSLCRHQWSKAFGGSQLQSGFSVTPTFDKGYAFAGYTTSSGNGGYDVYVVKTDSAGNILWQKTYGGSDWDFGYSIQQNNDSGFVVCGLTYSYGDGNGDALVIRTDKNGKVIWTKAIGGQGYDVGNSIITQGDTLYTIAGATSSFGKSDTNAYFIQTDQNGTLLQSKTFGSVHRSIAYAIRPTLDHGYILTGSIDSIIPGVRGQMLLKTDRYGNLSWMHQNTNGTWNDISKDVAQAPDSSYLCVGRADGGGYGTSSMHVMHLDQNGKYMAAPSLGGNKIQFGNSTAISKNGNVVFAGATSSYGEGNYDMYLIRFKNDSIVQSYTNVIRSFADTLATVGISNQPDLSVNTRVYPNPSSAEINILIQSERKENYKLSVYDEAGKCVIESVALKNSGHGQSSIRIEKETLPKGIYMYAIDGEEKKVATGKLIVE